MSGIVSSGELAETAGAAGPSGTGFANSVRFKGAAIRSNTGDGVMTIYNAEAATAGKEICELATSDEQQCASFIFPSDDYIPCDDIYYVISGGGTVTGIMYRY